METRITTKEAQLRLGAVLHRFQKLGANFLYSRGAALLADEMGLGKTIEALAAVRPDEGAAVVCPAFLVANWKAEIARFRSDLVALPDESLLESRFPLPGEILVTAYSRLPAVENETRDESGEYKFPRWIGEGAQHAFTLILDEAHYVKSSSSQRSARVRALAGEATRVWALTGTPMINRPPELWALLQAAKWQGKRVFGSWDDFVRVFGGRKNRYGHVEWNGVVLPEAHERLKLFMLRRTRAEVMPELPRKTRRDLPIELGRTTLDGQDFSFLDGWSDAQVEAEAKPAGALFTARRILADAKADALGELLDEHEDASEPVVVFAVHAAVVQSLGLRKGCFAITGATDMEDRQTSVDLFQGGTGFCIAGTYGAMGTGLTLTRAAHVILVDEPFTPAERDQAEDRVCRIGQERPVLVTTLMSSHPLDLRVRKILERKRETLRQTGLEGADP